MTNNTNLDLVIVLEADRYAAAEHGRVEQKRKYADLPYIVHPRQVAGYVRTSIHGDAINIAVALLHDVIEDTRYEGESILSALDRMRKHFIGLFVMVTDLDRARVMATDIVQGVAMVTDISKPEDGNRKTRKAMDRDHAGQADAPRKTVKLADIKSMPSIVKNDPGFARKWVAEKADVYPLLEGGDPDLFKEVGEMIAAYRMGSFNPEAYKIV
jgi:(p)ppGpp synthase/HD superfamily hydrolase